MFACAERAKDHWGKTRERPRERAFGIRLKGLGELLSKNHRVAIESLQEALRLFLTLQRNHRDVLWTLNDLAFAESQSGDLDSAERDYCEALRIAREIENPDGTAVAMTNLASLRCKRADWTGAERLGQEALASSTKIGRSEYIARSSFILAGALARQGKKAEALPHAERAIEIYSALCSPDLEAARATLREC